MKISRIPADELSEMEARWDGTYHVRVVGLTKPLEFARAERTVLPTASAAKLCILCELFRQSADGVLDLDGPVTWTAESFRSGDGVLKAMRRGLALPLYNLAVLMMTVSDNIATQVILERVGGDKVARFMHSLGLKNTAVPPTWPSGEEGEAEPVSTAWDLCELAAKIYRREILTPAACEDILRIMRFNRCTDMLPRYIPVGEDMGGDAEEWIAHKQGYGTCRVEVGVVCTKPIAYAIGLFFNPRLNPPAAHKCLADYPPVLAAAEACRLIHQRVVGECHP